MKPRNLSFWLIFVIAFSLASGVLFAQEKKEEKVDVKKEGKNLKSKKLGDKMKAMKKLGD